MIESDFGPHALSNYSSLKEAARARGSEPRSSCVTGVPPFSPTSLRVSTPTGRDSRSRVKDEKQFLLRLTCFSQFAFPADPTYAIRGPYNRAGWTHTVTWRPKHELQT